MRRKLQKQAQEMSEKMKPITRASERIQKHLYTEKPEAPSYDKQWWEDVEHCHLLEYAHDHGVHKVFSEELYQKFNERYTAEVIAPLLKRVERVADQVEDKMYSIIKRIEQLEEGDK